MSYGATLKASEGPMQKSILNLWNSGFDTCDIARFLYCSEPEVYNIMALMRGQAA